MSAANLSEKSDDEIDTWICNYERHQRTSESFYVELIQEQSRRRNKGLNLDLSLALLKRAARERRFVSYGELAKESGVEWSIARHAMNGSRGHLDNIVSYCFAHNMPLLSSICVNGQSLKSGELEKNALKGFIAAAKRLKIPVHDETEYYRKCQADCFSWANSLSD